MDALFCKAEFGGTTGALDSKEPSEVSSLTNLPSLQVAVEMTRA